MKDELVHQSNFTKIMQILCQKGKSGLGSGFGLGRLSRIRMRRMRIFCFLTRLRNLLWYGISHVYSIRPCCIKHFCKNSDPYTVGTLTSNLVNVRIRLSVNCFVCLWSLRHLKVPYVDTLNLQLRCYYFRRQTQRFCQRRASFWQKMQLFSIHRDLQSSSSQNLPGANAADYNSDL